MFIWIIEIIPSEFHGPVHASFRVDHSNRYRGAHTHSLSLSLTERQDCVVRGTIGRRMAGCASPSRMSLSLSITTDLRRLELRTVAAPVAAEASPCGPLSNRQGMTIRLCTWGNAALIHPLTAYNRALCFRLTSLTFKSTLLGSARPSLVSLISFES